ncbi:DnaJ C-terminal domain-containing protein [Streptomyces sp. NPDC029006]|uniref:DnaJ C-terminal domain-containing protein n=1 Tax=Streptomyces sp. NPDC029006 TaxID=3155467 RepID=UPI0033D483AA
MRRGRIIREQHTYKVRIPAGIKDGRKIRIRELGGPGKHGGAPQDLYVTVHVDRRSTPRYGPASRAAAMPYPSAHRPYH